MALPPPQQGSLPAGWLAFAGRELNPLDRDERFQITCSSPFPGLTLTLHPALPDAVLPKGFHRIRHYGLFANTNRAENIATARALFDVTPPAADPQQQPDGTPDAPRVLPCSCPRCGARMIVIEVFARDCEPRWRPTPSTIDTS
jgi:hypothetical protein